jgi:predicted nucleic acid-binding protein
LRSTFDLKAALRRVKPEKRNEPLRPREPFGFVTEGVDSAEVGAVLLDTCVYLDAGRGRLSPGAERLLATVQTFHCIVCVGELAYALGRLDPAHPDTPASVAYIRDALGRVRPYRTLAPDSDDYIEAAIITGTLARTQSLAPPERRKLMHDALVFLTARRIGYPVLTANAKDFDLIQQLSPDGKAIYYEPP